MQWYDFIREGKEQHYLIFQWSLYTHSKLGDSVLSLEELTPESWDWKQRLAVINLLHRNWSLVCYLRAFVPRRSEKTNCNSALFFSRIFQVHSCAPEKVRRTCIGLSSVCVYMQGYTCILPKPRQEKGLWVIKYYLNFFKDIFLSVKCLQEFNPNISAMIGLKNWSWGVCSLTILAVLFYKYVALLLWTLRVVMYKSWTMHTKIYWKQIGREHWPTQIRFFFLKSRCKGLACIFNKYAEFVSL